MSEYAENEVRRPEKKERKEKGRGPIGRRTGPGEEQSDEPRRGDRVEAGPSSTPIMWPIVSRTIRRRDAAVTRTERSAAGDTPTPTLLDGGREGRGEGALLPHVCVHSAA